MPQLHHSVVPFLAHHMGDAAHSEVKSMSNVRVSGGIETEGRTKREI